MPEFLLNQPPETAHPFYSLDPFARGYIEAMFFTNGDTGDERETLLNDWGVEKLTREAVANIARDCAEFQSREAFHLSVAYSERNYEAAQAGRDFWFTRQGHGVGFWDRTELDADDLGKLLTNAAKEFCEASVEAYRGWIYYR
jgi:hypothetical protein